MDIELEDRRCLNPNCLLPFRVTKTDTKTLYHSLACKASHTNKAIDWTAVDNKKISLPKEIKDYIKSTEIPKFY